MDAFSETLRVFIPIKGMSGRPWRAGLLSSSLCTSIDVLIRAPHHLEIVSREFLLSREQSD